MLIFCADYSISDKAVNLIETWHYVNEDNSTASRKYKINN